MVLAIGLVLFLILCSVAAAYAIEQSKALIVEIKALREDLERAQELYKGKKG
jgi:hypothetical protein